MNTLELQKEKFKDLKKELDYMYKNNKIYKQKLDNNNIKLDDIKNINDLNKLPLITKKDFMIDYPYGFYSSSINNIVKYHSSSGTTGKALVVGFTKNDLKLRNSIIIKMCKDIGITKDDVVQICHGFGMFTGGLGFYDALSELGCTIIPTSSGSTEKQLFFMKQLHTTVLITSPSYAMHIYEVSKEIGINIKELDIRIIKVGSEILTDSMRKKLKEAWGENVIISQDYGMTESMGPCIASECKYCNNMHIYNDNIIYELVDPITKKPTNSDTGELVISTLHNECFPIIRYSTNDIVKLEYKTCKCGKTSMNIKKFIGRSDDMIKVKGVKVYVSQIEEFILSHNFCSSNYEILLTNKDFLDEIEIKIEYNHKIDFNNKSNITKIINKEKLLNEKFKSYFGIKANIKLIEPNSIKRQPGKIKRIKRKIYTS